MRFLFHNTTFSIAHWDGEFAFLVSRLCHTKEVGLYVCKLDLPILLISTVRCVCVREREKNKVISAPLLPSFLSFPIGRW